jgi:phosphinothricin acetyltransferase
MTGSQEEISWEQQQQWFANLDHENVLIWIHADSDERWIGYGQLKIEYGDKKFGVSSHAVTESYRGKGYGEKILLHIIEMARLHGCQAMRAEIFKSNAASLGLVYKLGYTNTKDLGDVWEVQLPL